MSTTCAICKSSDVNDVELGEILACSDVHVHYFCLLLTTSLAQNGEDDEGLLGFLVEDIKKCVSGLKKKKCYICYKPHANIECNSCSRKFHTSCGLNRCLNIFTGQFESYCQNHHRISTKEIHKNTYACLICYSPMDKFNPITSIRPDCCKNGWMHKICVAQYAKNAGYFCKCPLCNNDEKFRNYIVHRGIFIPDRDAAWELEPNAYSELLERPKVCQATNCCASRRDIRNKRNKMKTCSACGQYIAHVKCWYKSNVCRNFICNNCTVSNDNDESENEVQVNNTVEEIGIDSDEDHDANKNFRSLRRRRCRSMLMDSNDDIVDDDINTNYNKPARRQRRCKSALMDSSSSDSCDVVIRELRGRKVRLSRSIDRGTKSELRQSLDSSNISLTSENSMIQSTSKISRNIENNKSHPFSISQNIGNNQTYPFMKRRRRNPLRVVDATEVLSDCSDDIDWNPETSINKRHRSEIQTSRQSTKSECALCDISNNNSNAAIFGSTPLQANSNGNVRLQKRRRVTKIDGLTQTKIDMYFKKLTQ